MRLSALREGRALIYVPDTRPALRSDGVLEPAWLEVFYNPTMTLNRDLSVAAAAAFLGGRRGATVLDALAGTGVRGVRYLLEVASDGTGVINDIDPRAYELIARNIELNGLAGRATPANRDASSLMLSLSHEMGVAFDLVDVDPFGSPAPYVSPAISVTSRSGMLGITATDLAVLGGSKAAAARRVYGAVLPGPLREYREVAMRVLLAYVASRAAEHDKALRPLIAVSLEHYVRLHVAFERGARVANETLSRNIGCFRVRSDAGAIELADELPDGKTCFGPVWIGPLGSPEFVGKVLQAADRLDYLESRQRLASILEKLVSEVALSNFFHYRLDSVCSRMKSNIPKMAKVRAVVEGAGYRFSESHLGPLSFRTDAPPDFVADACVKASRT